MKFLIKLLEPLIKLNEYERLEFQNFFDHFNSK